MRDGKELSDFMHKKNNEARGEAEINTDENDDFLPDAIKGVKQEAGREDLRAAKALSKIRFILNMMFVIPLVLAVAVLIGYILLKFIPSILFFIRQFFVIVMSGN